MRLTPQQIEGLAPDDQVLSAGRKLGKPAGWHGLGRQDAVLWGEYRGSALYQVRVDLTDAGYRCSCPSRKQPCKHVIGLLTLAAQEPVPADETAPDWVAQWLARRRAAVAQPAPGEIGASGRLRQTRARTQRTAQRQQRILAGCDVLERWMCDVVRNGLAGLELQPRSFWEQQAARLVDAQAPGLAGRVRRLSGIPGSAADWCERLLAEMGKLELLIHAFRRLDQLDPPLQHDVRQLVGIPLSAPEVVAQGEHVIDDWALLGQVTDDEDGLHAQRSWLVGLATHHTALVLQFAPGPHPSFPFVSSLNTVQRMELRFWPGAYPLRARIHYRLDETYRLDARRPGYPTITTFLTSVAGALARNPWLDRFLAVLHDVVPIIREDGAWWVRDREGVGLPLLQRGYWRSLANSGGYPMDLYGEWDGSALRPLALRVIEDILYPEAS